MNVCNVLRDGTALEFPLGNPALLVVVEALALVAHALAAPVHARTVEALQDGAADAPPELV